MILSNSFSDKFDAVDSALFDILDGFVDRRYDNLVDASKMADEIKRIRKQLEDLALEIEGGNYDAGETNE